jgi:phosphoribosylglycinamide formyltransferase-1
VEVCVVDPSAYADRQASEQVMVERLQRAGAQWIVLAGFMRRLTARFLTAFEDRVLNIHPALCPAFPGLGAQAQALEHGVRVTGCTVHFAAEEVDQGPIVAQAIVPVLAEDTADSLAARLLEQEHELLVCSLQWLAEGRLEWVAVPAGGRRRVRLRGVEPLLGCAEATKLVCAARRA